MRERVSICIPAYNASRTIADTLESIVAQSYRDLLIVVVDNASTDNTVQIALEYAKLDDRVRVIAHKSHIDGLKNFDRCINVADGEYTCIYHADDVYDPTIIEKEVAFLNRNANAGAVFTGSNQIDAEGAFIRRLRLPPEITSSSATDHTFTFEEIFRLLLRDHNFLVCPSAMVRTAIYKEHVVSWNGSLFGSSADLGVWLRILEKYEIGILPEALIDYRISADQWTTKYLYSSTDRTDFFKVIDYYLEDQKVIRTLTSGDRSNLLLLEARDKYSAAANCIIKGDLQRARALTVGAFDPQVFKAAASLSRPRLGNRLRVAVWWYGVGLYMLARCPSSDRIGKLIERWKYRLIKT